MEVNEAKRLRQFEEENRRLKQMVADLSLDNQALKEVVRKKWRARSSAARRCACSSRPSR